MNLPSVIILSLGGTIAMTESDRGGVVPTLSGDALVAAVPQLKRIAAIEARSFRQLPSAQLQFEDIEALAQTIAELDAAGPRGFVITQGTDTIEETAFALDRLLDIDTPVVVTGAMRNPTVAGADGPANVLASVQVAISDAARGLGCLVVMNDEVHAARFVRKMHTSRTDAFASPASGRIGWVAEGRFRLALRPPRMPGLALAGEGRPAQVALVAAGLGDNGEQVRALLAAGGFDGLVVEATGGGHVSLGMAESLEEAARAMPVILASRIGVGDTLTGTYGFPGSEIDLQRRGLLVSGCLDGRKARVLLTLVLRHCPGGRDAVADAFAPWSGDSSCAS